VTTSKYKYIDGLLLLLLLFLKCKIVFHADLFLFVFMCVVRLCLIQCLEVEATAEGRLDSLLCDCFRFLLQILYDSGKIVVLVVEF